jgi:hypothetical protein
MITSDHKRNISNCSIIGKSTWPLAVEQLEIIACLLDPETHNGVSPGYAETATSHLFYVGSHTLVLKRPMMIAGIDCRTPEARWNWSESQCLKAQDGLTRTTCKTLPIVRQFGRLRLGGPGTALDWVLQRGCSEPVKRSVVVPVDWPQQFSLGGLRNSVLNVGD